MKIYKVIKNILLFIVVVFFIFLIAVSYSSEEFILKCNGKYYDKDVDYGKVLYLEFTRFGWLIQLWSKSFGNIKGEIPGKEYLYYQKIGKAGTLLSIYNFDDKICGHFSELSYRIVLNDKNVNFEGDCEKVHR